MRILLSITLSSTMGLSAAEVPDFTRDVRPILSNYCFKCHGPDEKTRKGELRLDTRTDALKPAESGAQAVVPGKPEKSELITRIFADDEEEVMPPASTKKVLTAAQKDILKRWVAAGAEYQQHWAFIPPKRTPVPQVNGARVENAIDAFVAEKLRTAGLAQSPEADAAALCRRMYFDLVGLPPTEEQLEAFILDAKTDRKKAIERLVDQLLASPQYGERWARRWLDLARYADTNGYEKDRDRSIWPYRDWVVNALNADMPYDQFTIEQLAGDLLPNATVAQKIATGFHRNTMLNEEGGIDPLEFRFHAVVDRAATTGTTWLGLTVGCAQCHTHKYDPITHREYYQMFSFLNNADEPELDLPTSMDFDSAKQRTTKLAQLIEELPAKWPVTNGEDAKQVAETRFRDWLANARDKAVEWTRLRPTSSASNLPILTVEADDVIFASGDISKSDTYRLRFENVPRGTTAIRLEALPDPRLPAHGPGMTYYEGPKGDFFMGEFEVLADGKRAKISQATESYSKNNFGNNPATAAMAVDGDFQTGWSCAQRFGEPHEAVFVLAEPLQADAMEIKMTFGRHYACSLGKFRISVTTRDRGAQASPLPDELGQLLLLADEKLTGEQRGKLREHFLLNAPELAEPAKAIQKLRKPSKPTTTLVMRERPPQNPRPTFIHNRGEFLQPTERVEPGVLSVLNPFPKDAPKNRLGFARWLVSRDHPLTARVAVNRAWAAFFGRGFVKTTDDFGFQGETPSHPELLDWLAVEFMENGWSQKKLHRQIVLSATYQQAVRASTKLLSADPENRLLARFPRLRLEAEMVRDAALRASGLLSLKMGGPGVRPPQPEGVTEVAYGAPKWNPDQGENRYRRSLYTFAKRTAPFALYNTFDAPTGEACVARRDVSNTPLQALTVLNDEVFMEVAEALGKQLTEAKGDDTARVRILYRRLVSRDADSDEIHAVLAFYETQRARAASGKLAIDVKGGKNQKHLPEVVAWTLTVRALLNLDEALCKG